MVTYKKSKTLMFTSRMRRICERFDTTHSGNEIPMIQFTPLEIIYNKIHPSIKLHLKEKPTQLMTIHLVQEIKQDIIYRRMNTNVNQQGRNLTRISAPTSCPPSKKRFHYLLTRELETFKTALTF
jgi:hypothetical protein